MCEYVCVMLRVCVSCVCVDNTSIVQTNTCLPAVRGYYRIVSCLTKDWDKAME